MKLGGDLTTRVGTAIMPTRVVKRSTVWSGATTPRHRDAGPMGFRPLRNGSRAMTHPTLGDQELALLQHLAERGGGTVGELAEEFGSPRGLARSTVLTMMERLRAKGFLERSRVEGVYRYMSRATPGELLRGAVSSFVERTLGGSISPVVAYLTEEADLGDRELAELEALVERLSAQRAGERP